MSSDQFDNPTRRTFLRRAAAGAGTLLGAGKTIAAQAQAPAIVTAERLRPQITSGVMSGDITRDSAMLWSRTDRAARMLVDYALTPDFKDARKIAGPLALGRHDYTARIDLRGLPVNRRIYYRVGFQDLVHETAVSAPVSGSLIIPGGTARDISFAFSGDEAGQGWASSEAWGGYRVYEAMRRFQPDFSFIPATRFMPMDRYKRRSSLMMAVSGAIW